MIEVDIIKMQDIITLQNFVFVCLDTQFHIFINTDIERGGVEGEGQ